MFSEKGGRSRLSLFRQLLTKWRKSRARRWVSHNIEYILVPPRFRKRLGREESGMLVRIGIKPIAIKTVGIDELCIQTRSEWLTHQLGNVDTRQEPPRLMDSYLVEFLREYQVLGENLLEINQLRHTNFYNVWKDIDSVGYRYDWFDYPRVMKKNYSPEVIQEQAIKLVNVYKNIKEIGYCNGIYSNRMISALELPFENSRFNCEHVSRGYEIWSGHHRAACLAALGINGVDIVLLTDRRGRYSSR